MHNFLHVEHLFFDLPDLPSDFKYFVKIVNICTNYLANSLSDFSEIIPQNSEKMHIWRVMLLFSKLNAFGSATKKAS